MDSIGGSLDGIMLVIVDVLGCGCWSAMWILLGEVLVSLRRFCRDN